MRNLRLDICYDGTRYRGWQRLAGAENTIQGKLETVLGRILGEPIEISGSGRTDAGVHAVGQVANFHCCNSMPSREILSQLRRYLPEDIGIYSCRDVPERFHARLNARTKTYRYRLWNSEMPCVFQRRYVTVDARVLDIGKMQQAASLLVGRHDFSAFTQNQSKKKSTKRELFVLNVERSGDEVIFTLTGNGFLYHMVRILVGTLLEVGRGEREPMELVSLFGGERALAGELAPPMGLCLMEVTY